MNEEISTLQKRLHEITAGESDKDSSDPLSELDRQEELLKNISTKNKHIKKLIRDIEVHILLLTFFLSLSLFYILFQIFLFLIQALQIQNIEQSKTIIEKETVIQQLNSEVQKIKNQIFHEQEQNQELNETIKILNDEIKRLEGNITYLEEEKDRNDNELKEFIEKLEEKSKIWRNIIDDKEQQLESLRKKYEKLHYQNYSTTDPIDYTSDTNGMEMKKLVEVCILSFYLFM